MKVWDARIVIPDIDPVKFLKSFYAYIESIGGEVVARELTEKELALEEANLLKEASDGEKSDAVA